MTGPETAWWDVLDDALGELRTSRSAADVAQRACSLAQRGCGVEAVSLGTVAAGTWAAWCRAGPRELLDALADDEGPPVLDQAVRTGRPASRDLTGGRRHLVVPVSGSDGRWLLQMVGPADRGDLGLELAESFAAALGSTMALVALMQHVDQQRFLIARLVNGIGDATERGVELADTPRPGPDSAVRGPAASWSSAASTAGGLSPRQREVLDLMVRGLSNGEIAERLVVTLPTVKSHVRAVLRSCGAVNRSDAITRLVRGEAPPDGGREPSGAQPR